MTLGLVRPNHTKGSNVSTWDCFCHTQFKLWIAHCERIFQCSVEILFFEFLKFFTQLFAHNRSTASAIASEQKNFDQFLAQFTFVSPTETIQQSVDENSQCKGRFADCHSSFWAKGPAWEVKLIKVSFKEHVNFRSATEAFVHYNEVIDIGIDFKEIINQSCIFSHL